MVIASLRLKRLLFLQSTSVDRVLTVAFLGMNGFPLFDSASQTLSGRQVSALSYPCLSHERIQRSLHKRLESQRGGHKATKPFQA